MTNTIAHSSPPAKTGRTRRQTPPQNLNLNSVAHCSPSTDGVTLSSKANGEYKHYVDENGMNYYDVITPAKSKDVDQPGTSFLAKLGHDSPQALVDRVVDVGTKTEKVGRRSKTSVVYNVDVKDIDRQRDVRNPDGTVGCAHEKIRTWTKNDGSETVSRINRGENTATEWELKKPYRDGEITQRFVQGSEDTSIKSRYTDKDGFKVTTEDTDQRDLAKQLKEKGIKNVPDEISKITRNKEAATIDDLKKSMGDDFGRLMKESGAFKTMVNDMGEGTFSMAHNDVEATISETKREEISTRSRGTRYKVTHDTKTVSSEMYTMLNDCGQTGVLSRDPESGQWSVNYKDENKCEYSTLAGKDGSRLELNPDGATHIKKGGFEVGDIRTTVKVTEDGIKTGQYIMKLGNLANVGKIAEGLAKTESALTTGGQSGKFVQNFGTAADALGLGLNSIAAVQAFSSGDFQGGALSTAGGLADAGGLASGFHKGMQATGTLQKAAMLGKSLGVAGGAVTSLYGLSQISDGEYARGGLNLLSGAGTITAIAGNMAGASWAGPVGWGAAAVGTLGSVVYDYVSSTDMADVQI